MTRRTLALALAVPVVWLVAACSSQAVHTLPGSALPSTTSSPPSTALATGWTPIALDALPGQPFAPCCAADWIGEPSPPLPADGGPLLPGDYSVSVTWAADPSRPPTARLARFVRCSELPSDSCADPTGGDTLGVDLDQSIRWELPLDDSLRVVLIGFNSYDESVDLNRAAVGTGADLGELAVAVETAYQQVFAAPLAAGATLEDIIAALRVRPVEGFTTEAPDLEGVVFTYEDAPPLLFQVIVDGGRGTDILATPSLHVADGMLTLYVYAGYYS